MCYLRARRPSILPFNRWMADSVEYLETSLTAATSDKQLAQWARLQELVEENTFAGGSSDFIARSQEPSFILSLTAYENRLRGIRKMISANDLNGNDSDWDRNKDTHCISSMFGNYVPQSALS